MISAYRSSFSRCKTAASLPQIQKLHAQIVEESYEETPALQNALIKAYARGKQPEIAAQRFHQMCVEGNLPRRLSFIAVLACYAAAEPCSEFGCSSSLHKIKQIHARLLAVGLHRDVVIATNLVTAYARNHSSTPAPDSSIAYTNHSSNPAAPDTSIAAAAAAHHHHHHRCGFMGSRIYVDDRSLDHAQRAFDQVHEPDTVLWTALIVASMQSGHADHRGLHLLQQMSMEGAMPNEFTYATVLSASNIAKPADVWSLRSVHASVVSSPHASDAVVCNGLIHMYAKCQIFDAAVRVFDDLGDRRNAVSWNGLMMIACSQNDDRPERALGCLREMQERGVCPDESMFVGTLDMLSSYGLFVDKGKQVHAHLLHHRGPNMGSSKLRNALLNMYARCGTADATRLVFDGLVHRDVITWTTMIACYAQHGLAEAALELALQMQHVYGIAPNSITFVNLLSVCSHSGLLVEACQCFALMMLLGTMPGLEHYNCIIDSLARLGLLDEGEAFLENMPIVANSTLWTTLLGGCRLHLDVERGERTAACILQLGTEEAGPHVWLWNVR